jgi:hypothetical protein
MVATETTVLGAASSPDRRRCVGVTGRSGVGVAEDAAFLPAPLPASNERRADWRRGVDWPAWADPDP